MTESIASGSAGHNLTVATGRFGAVRLPLW
jgi:hypothetical protein